MAYMLETGDDDCSHKQELSTERCKAAYPIPGCAEHPEA